MSSTNKARFAAALVALALPLAAQAQVTTAKPASPSFDTGETYFPDHLYLVEEGSGTTLEDRGDGGDIDLTLSATTGAGPDWGTDGTHGNKLTFVPANEDRIVGSGLSSLSGTQTVCYVAKLVAGTGTRVIGQFSDPSQADRYADIVEQGDEDIESRGRFDNTLQTNTSTQDGTGGWDLICHRFSDTTSDWSLNGAAWDTDTTTNTGLLAAITQWSIGADRTSSPGNYIDMEIVAFWWWKNTSLSDANIASVYNSGNPWPIIGVDGSSCSGTPSITDVDSDEQVTATQSNVVITLTGGCASQGSGSVTLRQSGNSKTLSVDSWSATSIQVDMSGVGMGVTNGLLYGSMDIRVTNDAGNFDDQAITANAPSGTIYHTLSGGISELSFDQFGNPTRLFGDPLDLQTTSQIGIRNASGCTASTDITINDDGSVTADEACVDFDWDFSRSGLYLGTIGTVAWAGCPATFDADVFADIVFQKNLAIPALDVSQFFSTCDEPITSWAMLVLGSSVDSTTDVDGAVINADTWLVDDATVLLDNVGDYVQCASGPPTRLIWANPLTNQIRVANQRDCANNAQVNVRTTSAASIPGLSFNTSTGVLSGTPTTVGTSGPIVFRGTSPSGVNADSP